MLMLAFHLIWVQLLFVFAGGVVLLHFAGKTSSAPLKVGGFVLVAGAILSTVCVMYYAAKYMGQGAFESAHPMMHGMGTCKMMRPGMMDGGRMMGPGLKQESQQPSDEPGAGSKDEHGH